MKKLLALILALCMVLCMCGCKGEPDNSSSESDDVIIEEIIVDQTGSNITSSDNNSSDTQSQNTSSTDDNTSKVESQDNNKTTIDYETVVEVDICSEYVRSYLNAKNAKDQLYWLQLRETEKITNDYQALSLSWQPDGSQTYTLYISEKADFSNAQVSTVAYEYKDGKYVSSKTESLCVPGKTYYWKILGEYNNDAIAGGKIKIKDAPVRWVKIDGIHNVRDMGGWKTESGKTVKYEMLYRGPSINGITDKGVATIKQLGIKTEIDIRREDQKEQKQGTGMNWVFLEMNAQYDNIFEHSYVSQVENAYKEIFKLLSDEKNYPIYTHCQHGSDRTGTFAFIVNGLLGVSYEDLTRDFEVSSFSGATRWRDNATASGSFETDGQMTVQGNYVAWGILYDEMMTKYGTGDGKLSSAIENFLINKVGVPKSQIDSFRNIMLK